MRVRVPVFTSLVVAVLLAVVQPSGAKMRDRMTLTDIFAFLKPGQWVEVEGIVQRDRSVLCTEIKLLASNLLDDDWELTGVIQKVNQEKQEIELLRVPIKMLPETEFDRDHGTIRSFADMAADKLLEIKGTYLKGGTFMAREIEDRSAKLAKKPELKGRIDATGRVENIDLTNHTITLMGITFQLTEGTKGKSAIK